MQDLDIPDFDPLQDSYSGDPNAGTVIIQYGDYTCPHTRRARDVIKFSGRKLFQLQGKAVFVFRTLPAMERSPQSEHAARASIAAGMLGKFMQMHSALLDTSEYIDLRTIEDLVRKLDIDKTTFWRAFHSEKVTNRIADLRKEARLAGVNSTPVLFIDGRMYSGPWEEHSIIEAIAKPLDYRLKQTSEDFFNWAAAGGLSLLIALLLALLFVNTGNKWLFNDIKATEFGLLLGSTEFSLSISEWVNDGLMTIFFLLVSIEIKKEFIRGELSNPAVAALPIFGAIGGMVVPVIIYLLFNISSDFANGWGVPMATDIAFALGLMALLRNSVPAALFVFVSALAIIDDLGAIIVIALFYGHGFNLIPFAFALLPMIAMSLLNRNQTYSITPYLILGTILWGCIYESGLHATLSGVITAAFIPIRRRLSFEAASAQISSILDQESRRIEGATLQEKKIQTSTVNSINDLVSRLQDPGSIVERLLEKWSKFLILPLFAFINTGLDLSSFALAKLDSSSWGVFLGLAVGKPVGILLFCWFAVSVKWAQLPTKIKWKHLIGAGCLCGVGFTMSVYIAAAAFPDGHLETIKASILFASILSAALGVSILLLANQSQVKEG